MITRKKWREKRKASIKTRNAARPICSILFLVSTYSSGYSEPNVPPPPSPNDTPLYRRIEYQLFLDSRRERQSTQAERIPLAIGSGLTKVLQIGETTILLGLTDRGPNLALEAETNQKELVIFPKPHFTPLLVGISLYRGQISRLSPKLIAETKRITGLSLDSAGFMQISGPKGEALCGLPPGNSSEVGVDRDLKEITRSAHNLFGGIDPEAVTFDPKLRELWIAEEYLPSIAQIDLQTGRVIRQLRPGAGLPSLLTKRIPNRGFESLTHTPSGDLIAILQSPLFNKELNRLESLTRLLRIRVRSNSQTETTTFAIPLPREAKPKSYKIGDVAAISDTHFLALESYDSSLSKTTHRNLILLDLSKAKEIPSEEFVADFNSDSKSDFKAEFKLEAIRRVILKLGRLKGLDGKLEGLAILNCDTILISKDNDFGIHLARPELKGGIGQKIHFKDTPNEFVLIESQAVAQISPETTHLSR